MRHVVIIEDDHEIAELLARHFGSEGFSVATATDGRAGLHAVHLRRPDLIILDLLMPTMNGREVFRSLKANLATRDISVIIVSAIGSLEDRIALLEMGVDDFIVKPCSVKEVVARSRAVLNRAERKGVNGREHAKRCHNHSDCGRGYGLGELNGSVAGGAWIPDPTSPYRRGCAVSSSNAAARPNSPRSKFKPVERMGRLQTVEAVSGNAEYQDSVSHSEGRNSLSKRGRRVPG